MPSIPLSPRLLWGLLRPWGLPWIWLVPLVGYGWAHWAWALQTRAAPQFAEVLVAWTALHAGTMWLNAGLDRDQGAVLLGRPLPVPDRIERAAVVALALAPVLAWPAGITPFLCASAGSLLAVLYSSPHTRWKGDPVFGPLVNVVGYGVLSPVAGWSIVGVGAGPRTLAVLASGCALIFGVYALAQVFQRAEDAARGYRTLVVTHGEAATIGIARASLAAGFGGIGALVVAGWLPRECAVAAPVVLLVDRRLAAWAAQARRDPASMTEASARDVGYAVLLAGVLLIVGACLAFARDFLGGAVMVAGFGTAAGWPG